VIVILAGADNFSLCLRAADDLATELSRELSRWRRRALPFLFKLVVRISIRNVSGEFKGKT
jgi:hypothetical protein